MIIYYSQLLYNRQINQNRGIEYSSLFLISLISSNESFQLFIFNFMKKLSKIILVLFFSVVILSQESSGSQDSNNDLKTF